MKSHARASILFAPLLAPILFALAVGTPAACRADAPKPLYLNPQAPIEARIADLLPRLTQDEKLRLLALDSHGNPQKLDIPAVPRLGIPELRTSDSPAGLRDGTSSAFPMEVVMAGTWDPDLVRQVGAAIGEEARAKNRQVVYGPCVNVQRTPQSGRYFENFSEDPFLNARLASAYVEGMQSRQVAACVKHFLCNNQESGRHTINVRVDARAMHEIYLPAFEAAVKEAHVWALMPSVSHVNGPFIAQNKDLMTGLLRDAWGWDGLVISDWGSVHETVAAANAGTDVEMPDPIYFTPSALGAALADGKITQATLDEKVRRILRAQIRTGGLDGARTLDPSAVNSPAHQALARRVAQEGIVLLKNERGLLPFSRKALKTLAVLGPNAADTQLGGRWSADVTPFYRVSVLDGLKKVAGAGVQISFAQGCPRTEAGTPDALAEAVGLAAHSDAAVVVVGTDQNYEGEEMDPPDLHLPGDQEKLIRAVAKVNPNTVVVLNCGTPLVTTSWLPSVRGVLESWYAGQESGRAVGDLLFGDADPSGRLSSTFAVRREDYGDWGNYPGTGDTVTYAEGLYVGYRHFDKADIAPLFPFGFGLSYTTFAYSGLKVPAVVRRGVPATVQVSVTNTGRRAGAEVVQLYLRPLAPSVDRPVRELKGFARVQLAPGQTSVVRLTLDARSFSVWDVDRNAWRIDPGVYAVEVGSSSRDLRAVGRLRAL